MKPCPFCGTSESHSFLDGVFAYVGCWECGARGPQAECDSYDPQVTATVAYEKWNIRDIERRPTMNELSDLAKVALRWLPTQEAIVDANDRNLTDRIREAMRADKELMAAARAYRDSLGRLREQVLAEGREMRRTTAPIEEPT